MSEDTDRYAPKPAGRGLQIDLPAADLEWLDAEVLRWRAEVDGEPTRETVLRELVKRARRGS